MFTSTLLGVVTAMTASVPSAAAASSRPPHNIAANPYFLDACETNGGTSHDCVDLAVAAINRARAKEHPRVGSLVLPTNFRRLSPAEQTFVVINLERVDRGLRPLQGMVPAFNVLARLAAISQIDPTPSNLLLQRLGAIRYRSIWARDYGVLASDYEWMYDDGYASDATSNRDCRYAGAAGCWAHRRAILATFHGFTRLLAGVGSARPSSTLDSVAAVLAGGYGPAPHFTYTWRQALAHGAGGAATR